MNLLSIGASLGVVVAIFQWGWLGGIFNVKRRADPGVHPRDAVRDRLRPVDGLRGVPRLAHPRGVDRSTGDAQRGRHGTASPRTGRVITAAATIMICVFLSFVLGGERILELFGLSLASAVFLDAFIVRSLLLPSVLQLLGTRTWALPRLARPSAAAHRDRARGEQPGPGSGEERLISGRPRGPALRRARSGSRAGRRGAARAAPGRPSGSPAGHRPGPHAP